MKRKLITACATTAILAIAASGHAVTISIVRDSEFPDPGEPLRLHIIVDIAPENHTFTNGGLSLSVATSTPGGIAFTGAEVHNRELFGAPIWSITGVEDVSADHIGDLFAASVNTLALNPFLPGNPIVDGGTEFLFATIEYEYVRCKDMVATVELSQRPDPAFSRGQDVSDSLTFQGSLPFCIPVEPTTLLLAGICLMGAVGSSRFPQRDR